MNDMELMAEMRDARRSKGGAILPDQKIPILIEVDGVARMIDCVSIMPPAQCKQLFGVEGHHIILYTNEQVLR